MLRGMDFLRYSGRAVGTDTTALYAHPCAVRAFRGIRAPKFLDIERNIRKSHFPSQDVGEHFV